MKRFYWVYCLVLIIMLTSSGYAQVHFMARLSGDQEVPSVNTTSKGTAALTLTEQGLNYVITVDTLTNITDAQFRYGAMGDTGRAVKSITTSFRGNTAVGTWTGSDVEPLSNDLINALIAGKVYLNISTTANPKGEIRGQVVPAAGTSFRASLSGQEVVPSVISGASGTASFLLTDAGLFYSISVVGVPSVTAAHLQLGAIGTNGDAVRPITFQGTNAVGVWTKNDAQALTGRFINALLCDSIYINVQTAANPNGELRGQIIQSGGKYFYANFTGSQEVPANNSQSSGTGYFVLTNAGLIYAMQVNIADSVLAANFLNAPAGMVGNIVKSSTAEMKGRTIAGVWKSTDGEPLTPALVSELLKGNIYVNFHTAKNPNGEIRGQLIPSTTASFKSLLTSSQVRPATNSTMKGVGNFYLTGEGLNFNITLNGTDTLKTVQFYVGKIGQQVTYTTGYVRSVPEFRGKFATGVWKFTDPRGDLTQNVLASLLKDEVFISIRTTKDTIGAIRGQLLLSGGTTFRATLTASQEVPKVKSNALGTGDFILNDQGLVYRLTVDSLIVAASHFHLAPIGQPGGVVKDIYPDFSNNSAKGIWKFTGNQALTPDLMKALLTGKIYVNIHSINKPNGEIRGQLLLNDGWGLTASLNGMQEVPPTTSAATGTGAFTLTEAGLIYDVTVSGLTPTAAHFHGGPTGQSGDIIKTITSDFTGRSASGVWLAKGSTDSTSASAGDSLSVDNIGNLLNEGIYINVHTAANPNGEIRGQVAPTVSLALVSVKEKNNSAPKAFALEQNYPNPFNPSTIIKFSVPSNGQVELSVFNILGQKVMTLLNGELAQGSYQVKLDASNLSSGIYFYKLQAGQTATIKKMMLLK